MCSNAGLITNGDSKGGGEAGPDSAMVKVIKVIKVIKVMNVMAGFMAAGYPWRSRDSCV